MIICIPGRNYFIEFLKISSNSVASCSLVSMFIDKVSIWLLVFLHQFFGGKICLQLNILNFSYSLMSYESCGYSSTIKMK